jgi:choline kinase
VKAIVLAAGTGKRLGEFTRRHPKSLLRFGGETLLRRHLRILSSVGIEEIAVVAGHLANQIEAEVARAGCSAPVRILLNPLYRKGSALSLLAASGVLENSECLVMDADVLYDAALLARLVRAEASSCLLVDGKSEDSGEEVKVVERNGRVWGLGKSVSADGRIAGEAVGIYRFDGTAGRCLVERLRTVLEADPYAEYEQAIDAMVKECAMVCVDVDGLAWIEIDFPQDVERARAEIYPRLPDALN